jgi:NADH-ubiquinone oxidoreductase chain 2
MWVGQLGSGVGIFNGLFQVTAVTQGIDLFIYIVSALVLLISETQVQKYQLNNEEPAPCEAPTPWVAELAGSSNVEVQSIGFPGVSSLAGLPPRTFKILAEHPLIVLFSVLGMSSLISSSDFITIFLIIVGLLFKVAAAPFHMDVYDGVPTIVTAWLTTMPKISLFLFLLEFQEFALLSNWSTWTQLLLFNSMLSFLKVKFNLINDSTFFMLNPTLLLHSLHLLALYLFTQ